MRFFALSYENKECSLLRNTGKQKPQKCYLRLQRQSKMDRYMSSQCDVEREPVDV